jgi:hypothetical protein
MRDIARQHDVGAERIRRFIDAILQRIVDIRERQLRAFAMHRIGDTPRNRSLADDAGYQRSLSVQKSHDASAFDREREF